MHGLVNILLAPIFVGASVSVQTSPFSVNQKFLFSGSSNNGANIMFYVSQSMTSLTFCRWSSCQNLAHLRYGGGGENHIQVMMRPLMMRSLYLVGYVFLSFKQHDLLWVHLKHVSHNIKNKNKNNLNVGFLRMHLWGPLKLWTRSH